MNKIKNTIEDMVKLKF